MPEGDVEQLLVSLILDNRIQGHIDQVNKLLERGDRSAFFFKLYVLFLFIIFILNYNVYYIQVEGDEKICCYREMEHAA